MDIRADIVDNLSTHPPIQTLMPTPDGDCSFTHKTAGLTVVGKIRLGDTHWDLDSAKPMPSSILQLDIMPVKRNGTGLRLAVKVMAYDRGSQSR